MKNKQKIYIFILGSVCFFVSQQLIRIPLLNLLYLEPKFNVFSIEHQIAAGVFIALTAGIAEESFRFFAVGAIRNRQGVFWNPVILGLGHSFMEIVFLFVLPGVPVSAISALAVAERLIATVFHIEMSILVWNGFINRRKLTGFALAILFHGFADSAIPVARYYGIDVIYTEAAFIVVVFALAIFLKYIWVRREEI